MAAPVGYGLWVWFQNSPVAQGVALAGALMAAAWVYLTVRDARRRREMLREIELKGQRTARRVTDKAKEKTDATIRKADDARARVPDGPTADSLPDDIGNVLFDD